MSLNDKITLDGVATRFVAMTAIERQLFLATYAHEITIVARAGFDQRDYETARLCNETLHRLVGYMASLLRKPAAVVETSFIEMLVASAIQRGWAEILLRSMQTSQP